MTGDNPAASVVPSWTRSDRPGVPLPEDYAEQRLEFADSVSPEMTSSMHHDLERGNRLEVRWLSGAVVELGQTVGVDTPLNRAVADILSVHAEGRVDH